MAEQSEMPPIYGSEWRPKIHLEFNSPLAETDARAELLRFVAEKHDGHLRVVAFVWSEVAAGIVRWDGEEYHAFCERLVKAVCKNLELRAEEELTVGVAASEVIPRRSGVEHLARRTARLAVDLRLTLRRIAHTQSVSLEQRLEWQRMMTRTRLLDEHLKELSTVGVPTPDGGTFGGKGFRSTWQEAVVACASALKRAVDKTVGHRHEGDVVAPMIRDVGLALAMGQSPTEIFAAQMGKAGSLMSGGHEGAGGRDLHIGNWSLGILPPTAPLPIASATTTGIALASQRLDVGRFQLAPVGEGCSSSGEFWEALNFAGARGLPICYVIQNNQIALDTFPSHQNNAELWADKGAAVGLPSWAIDGSDPAAYYSSIATAREFAVEGGGPTLLHVETMRGCGHAHHHDDLYLGAPSGNPPGYVSKELLSYWAEKDPLPNHRELLRKLGVEEAALAEMEAEEKTFVDGGRTEMEAMDWPSGDSVRQGITSIHDAGSHADQLSRVRGADLGNATEEERSVPIGELAVEFSEERSASTYSRAIQQGMVAIAERYGRSALFMGQDMEVAGAFGMNIPLKMAGHSDLLLDMPLSESIIIHSATGAALGGLRPIAEIQFGGFAALAMNPLINNAAQLRWRWGAEVPLVVRIPLGAKTRSGPFHANMIESWFINDPGLIICFPSTPQDAYDLLVEAASLNDPVIFLEHLGMYGLRGGKTGWGDNISQELDKESVLTHLDDGEGTYKIGKAQVMRAGRDATIITWGAMVHVALKAAAVMAAEGKEVEVVDLRTILPFDAATCVESVKRTGRYLVLQEAQYTGALGHTVSSRIQEETFYSLEAAPVVIGALDTPVPFSPTLEDHTIPTAELVVEHLRLLCDS
jgi:2-oxoisovalerate dehydrogenase E1 component